jgi:lipopolysaccharide/colanic/teichoic acid biosynthesis glycosyltransferase
MTLWKMLPGWWRGSLPLPKNQRMMDATRFRAALERERMLADRSLRQFSVIEFSLRRGGGETTRRLIEVLESRLRVTDEFGAWDGAIGVLLPETPAEGARQLAERVNKELGLQFAHSWTVHVYPEIDIATESPGESAKCPQEAVAAELMFAQRLPAWKRTIDILAAASGLLLLSPILLSAALAIKLTSRGPVMFTQRRAGLGGRPFTIYKLRTMGTDAEALKSQLRSQSEQDGPAFKIKNDPRVTWIGRYLRKTCIDELPQLWNILVGDMTLVGPRPLPCDESDACQTWQRRRLDVTPGLTCIWQVRSGRSRIAFSEWMRMDLRYIRRRSPFMDLKLLCRTLLAVLLHRASH